MHLQGCYRIANYFPSWGTFLDFITNNWACWLVMLATSACISASQMNDDVIIFIL